MKLKGGDGEDMPRALFTVKTQLKILEEEQLLCNQERRQEYLYLVMRLEITSWLTVQREFFSSERRLLQLHQIYVHIASREQDLRHFCFQYILFFKKSKIYIEESVIVCCVFFVFAVFCNRKEW